MSMSGMLNRRVYLLLWSAVTVILVACGGDAPSGLADAEPPAVARIEGQVVYRERIMLPPASEVEVQLEDISRPDAVATVMASVMFTPQGGPPFAFSIDYAPADIDKGKQYALRARITDPDGRLRFSNTEYIDPFSGNPVEVLVQAVATTVSPTPTASGTRAGDAEPVAGEVHGEGDSDAAVVWILDTLSGAAAPAGAGGQAVDLQMHPDEGGVTGFAGCNRYRGQFSSDGHSSHGTPIAFADMATTLMACPDGAELERAYLGVLARVDAYRMQGDHLALLAGAEVVATFRPR